ncbi:hypothetical protein BC940DRAFT_337924 [Gongronella butleri]|nr:hypothetical protein BC940DRAFT_337924 [Gongronella butleri]
MAHLKHPGLPHQVLHAWRAVIARPPAQKRHLKRLCTHAQQEIMTSAPVRGVPPAAWALHSAPSSHSLHKSRDKSNSSSTVSNDMPSLAAVHSQLAMGDAAGAWRTYDALPVSTLPATSAQQLLHALYRDLQQQQGQLDARTVSLVRRRLERLTDNAIEWSVADTVRLVDAFGRVRCMDGAEAIASRHLHVPAVVNRLLGAYLRQWKQLDASVQQQCLTRMLDVVEKTKNTDMTALSHVLAAHIKMNDWHAAETWFTNVIVPSGLPLKRTTYHLLLQGAIRHQQRPQQWIDHMIKAGMKPNRATFKHILTGLAHHAANLAQMKQTHELNNTVASMHQCFLIMQHWQYTPTTPLLNDMLKAYLLAENQESHVDDLLGWFGLMDPFVQSCAPNVATFNTLMHHALRRHHDMHQADQWLHTMRQNGLAPDNATYGILIDDHLRHHRVDDALRALDEMVHQHQLPVNDVLRNILEKAAPHHPSVAARLREFDQINPLSNMVACNQYLSASVVMEPATALARVDKAVHQMIAHGLTPNLRTLNIALDLCGKLGIDHEQHVPESLQFLLATHPTHRGQKADAITYALRIRNAIYKQDLGTAERTLRTMASAGIKPNVYVFAHLVHGYVRQGLLEKAREIIVRVMDAAPYYVKPTAHVFAPLVDAYARAGDFDHAHSLFKRMIDAGIEPDLPMYTILARMFLHHGSPHEAIHVLKDLTVLDTSAQGVLLEAYGHAAMHQKHKAVFSDLSSSSASFSNGSSGSGSSATNSPWPSASEKPTAYFLAAPSLASASSPCASMLTASTAHVAAMAKDDDHHQPYLEPVQQLHAAMPTSPITDTIYLTTLGRLGRADLAYNHWKEMQAERPKDTTVRHYNALLGALCHDKRFYQAMKDVFDHMPCDPDRLTLGFMVHAADANADNAYIAHTLWPKRPTDPAPLLAKTYHATLKAILATDPNANAAKDLYTEFAAIAPSLPSSATVWNKEIHAIARANGWLAKKTLHSHHP